MKTSSCIIICSFFQVTLNTLLRITNFKELILIELTTIPPWSNQVFTSHLTFQLILQSLDDPMVVGSLLLQAVETSMSSSDIEASLVDVVSGVMSLLNILLRRAGHYMVSSLAECIQNDWRGYSVNTSVKGGHCSLLSLSHDHSHSHSHLHVLSHPRSINCIYYKVSRPKLFN